MKTKSFCRSELRHVEKLSVMLGNDGCRTRQEVRLGIDAPKFVPIQRKETYDKKK